MMTSRDWIFATTIKVPERREEISTHLEPCNISLYLKPAVCFDEGPLASNKVNYCTDLSVRKSPLSIRHQIETFVCK